MKNTIAVWYAAHKHVGESVNISQFTPLWNNEQFIPGRKDGGFKLWKINGIQAIKDLCINGKLLTFSDLSGKYNIPSKHFYKYLQVKNFMLSKSKEIMCIPELSLIEQMGKRAEKGLLSKYYNLIMAYSKDSTIDTLNAWRKDIREDIEEADWSEACLKAQKQSINTRLKLIQFKWLTRVYITPEKLNHISRNIPDTCVKCQFNKGTLIHCQWECSKIQGFWKEVINCMSEMFRVKIPLCARLCILGIYPKDFTRTKSQTKVLDFGLLHAMRTIALNWKNMEAPSIKQWKKELSECIGLERLTYISKGNLKEFVQLWEPCINIIASGK